MDIKLNVVYFSLCLKFILQSHIVKVCRNLIQVDIYGLRLVSCDICEVNLVNTI